MLLHLTFFALSTYSFPIQWTRFMTTYGISISFLAQWIVRSSYQEVFLVKGVQKICSKFTGEHQCRSGISIKLQSTLWHGFSDVNLLHIFRTPFSRNTSEWLILNSNFFMDEIGNEWHEQNWSQSYQSSYKFLRCIKP